MINRMKISEFDIDNIPFQKGRIAIVTGANTGLGFETALALAKKDMKVILACRNMAKAEKAVHHILRKIPNAKLETMQIDLSSLASVRNFAKNFLSKYNQLDVLINNAGIMVPPYTKTEDGFESQMASNYFGHFLLTGLLLEIIEKTPNSRIVSVASIAHKKGYINFEDLNFEKKYSATTAYRQSKLACLMFAYELQRRFDKAKLKTLSIAAHPGVSITDIARNVPRWMYNIALPFLPLVTHTPDKGAEPIVYAAIGKNTHGGDYFGPKGFLEMFGKTGKADTTPLSLNEEAAKNLWNISEKLTGIKYSFQFNKI
jgi:NAD(P)-dependent dehydrogenase (short-subunit alcohol dehydrogenase family)